MKAGTCLEHNAVDCGHVQPSFDMFSKTDPRSHGEQNTVDTLFGVNFEDLVDFESVLDMAENSDASLCPPSKKRGYIVLLICRSVGRRSVCRLVGRLVGRPDGFRQLSWNPFTTGVSYFVW